VKRFSSLEDDFDDITVIINWFLSDDAKRKRLAMFVGGFNEVRQEVFLIFTKRPPPSTVSLSTAVCNQTRWTLSRMVQNQYKWINRSQLARLSEVVEFDPMVGVNRSELVELVGSMIEEFNQDEYRGSSMFADRNVQIMKARYMEGKTLQSLADEFKITRERARQIGMKMIRRISQPMFTQIVSDFLE